LHSAAAKSHLKVAKEHHAKAHAITKKLALHAAAKKTHALKKKVKAT
jgi:hypothetical protein